MEKKDEVDKKDEVVEIFKNLLLGLFVLPGDMIKWSQTGIHIVRPKGNPKWQTIAKSDAVVCKTISFKDFKEAAKEIATDQKMKIANITDHSQMASVYKFI